MKGVIYARYSSENQREESIEGQIRECTAYAERNGITILGSYIDRALSAKTDNRPDFQRMVADSSKNMFDVIIVWKLDRFACNRYDSRMLEGKKALYDMTDVVDCGADADTAETISDPTEEATEPAEEETTKKTPAAVWIGVIAACVSAIAAILLNRKRLFGI